MTNEEEERTLKTFMCTIFRKATLVCEVPIRAYSEDELDEELRKFKNVTLGSTEIWQESCDDEIDNFWILEDNVSNMDPTDIGGTIFLAEEE